MGRIAGILRQCGCEAKRATLLDDYFVRENKGCGAVFKLHEVHDAVEVAHLTQDSWPFVKAGMTLAIANRFEQSAISPHNPILPVFCR